MNYFLVALAALMSLQVHAQTLRFGIVPQQSATVLATGWTPIMRYLSEVTGDNIVFATAPDIPTFEKRLLDGEYDVAYMNPYHFTFFNEHRGYKAIARRGDASIQGIIVVRKDSPINELSELNGQRLAFPSPAAFAASVVPRAVLANSGVEIEPVYVSSHDSVYLNVSKGFFVAGGGIGRTLNSTNPEVAEQLRVLWKTNEYTPHAIAAHPRVDTETFDRLSAALVTMADKPQGLALLKPLSISRWQASVDADWDDVRALKIDLLDVILE